MHLISPEILNAASGLSYGATGFALFVGLLLWTCGWRWHKFWVVFGITTAAGMLGLTAGQAAGGQVLVLGILLAFAGGVMALEVARILAFASGGLGAWLAVQTVLPQAHEMWAVFLSGGLFGVLLYKLWTMLITSLLGTLLAVHSVLILSAESGLSATRWVADNNSALNGTVIAFTLLGVIVQAYVAREQRAEEIEEVEEEHEAPAKKSWWKLAA
jgi:hypothetical protein